MTKEICNEVYPMKSEAEIVEYIKRAWNEKKS
jgi:hypothetical protein